MINTNPTNTPQVARYHPDTNPTPSVVIRNRFYRVGSVKSPCTHCGGTQVHRAYEPKLVGCTYWCFDCGGKDTLVYAGDCTPVSPSFKPKMGCLTLNTTPAKSTKRGVSPTPSNRFGLSGKAGGTRVALS